MTACGSFGTLTLYCPCGRLHAHFEQPPYLSREAMLALAERSGLLVRCPFCGERPAPVPVSSEAAAK